MENTTLANGTTKIWNKMYTCAFLANFLLCMAQFLVNPLVATYSQTLGADVKMTGIITGLYFGVAFAARPFSGPIITKLNKKHIMLFAYIMGFVTNVTYALSSSVPLFMVARILHGIQFAFIGSLNLTLASDSLPEDKMGAGLGMFGVGGAIATAFAPGLGMQIRDWVSSALAQSQSDPLTATLTGYKVVFAIAAACYVVSILPCLLMPYKPLTAEQRGSLGAWYKSIIAPEALLPAVAIMFFSVAGNLYPSFMEPFAKAESIANISWYFTVYAVVLLAARPLFGRITDKFGAIKIIIPGLVVFAASFVVISTAHSLPQILIGAVLAASGAGAAQPAIQTMAMKSVGTARRGAASNTNYFGMDLGLFLGPTVGGFVIDQGGYRSLFSLALIPIAACAAVLLVGIRPYTRYLARKSDER